MSTKISNNPDNIGVFLLLFSLTRSFHLAISAHWRSHHKPIPKTTILCYPGQSQEDKTMKKHPDDMIGDIQLKITKKKPIVPS